jgi:hypothetical protein
LFWIVERAFIGRVLLVFWYIRFPPKLAESRSGFIQPHRLPQALHTPSSDMESKNSLNQRRRVDKATSGAAGANSTRPALSLFQKRLLAYELGSMSKSKIEKEASKAVPQLHRLVSHAAIFDCTTRFMMDHINDTSVESCMVENALDEEELGCIDIDSGDDHGKSEAGAFEGPLEITHHASFNKYAELKADDGCAVVVTSALVDPEDDMDEDGEDESTSESSDDMHPDQDSWSNSSTAGDQCTIRSEWELLDAFSGKAKGPGSIISRHNDDHLLWSQQPKVLSAKQADELIADAFG